MEFLIRCLAVLIIGAIVVIARSPVDPNAHGGGFWNPACNMFVKIGCVDLGIATTAIGNVDGYAAVHP